MKTMACSFLTMVRTTLITLIYIQSLCSTIIPLCVCVTVWICNINIYSKVILYAVICMCLLNESGQLYKD